MRRTVTSLCGKLASLRNRPFAHSNCPRSSGGNSETDGRRALPFGFGRTRGSRRSGRADRSAPHIASLPSSLPVRLSVLAALCALRTNRTLSRTMWTDCAVAHRARNSAFGGVIKKSPTGEPDWRSLASRHLLVPQLWVRRRPKDALRHPVVSQIQKFFSNLQIVR